MSKIPSFISSYFILHLNMESAFKQIASLIGDPTRATVLWTLLDGRAYTATELALAAAASPQNISMHLNKLLQADLLRVEAQGRHRYYTFSRKEVAYAVEALANLIPEKKKTAETPVKYCRTCYDHLAGKIGVDIADSLLRQKLITVDFELTKKGAQWMQQTMQIDITTLRAQRRIFSRPCLDWSERRYHLAGAVGAALLDHMLAADWLRRTKNSRAIVITATGRQQLAKHFSLI